MRIWFLLLYSLIVVQLLGQRLRTDLVSVDYQNSRLCYTMNDSIWIESIEPLFTDHNYFGSLKTACVTDSVGNIVLIADATEFRNGRFEVIEGGERESIDSFYSFFSHLRVNSNHVIIHSDSLISIIHERQEYVDNQIMGKLYQTIIIIDQDLKPIILKKMMPFGTESENQNYSSNVAIVRKCGSANFWLLVQDNRSKKVHTWELDDNGHVVQSIKENAVVFNRILFGNQAYRYTYKQAAVSPDGTQLVFLKHGDVQYCEFNPLTGIISNAAVLYRLASKSSFDPYEVFTGGFSFCSADFAPDGRSIFLSTELYSYDEVVIGSRLFEIQIPANEITESSIVVNEVFSDYGFIDSSGLYNDDRTYSGVFLKSSDQLYFNKWENYTDSFFGQYLVQRLNPAESNRNLSNRDSMSWPFSKEFTPQTGIARYYHSKVHLPTYQGSRYSPIPDLSIIRQPYNQVFCNGQQWYFYPQANTPIDSVYWDFGDHLSDSNASTDLDAFHTYQEPGTYIVRLHTFGSCRNDTITDTIEVLQGPYLVFPKDTVICSGQNVNATIVGCDSCSFLWESGSFQLEDSNLSVVLKDKTIYDVTVSVPNGCIFKDKFSVDVHPLPKALAGLDDTVCIGDSLMLNAEGSGSFLWQPSVGLSRTDIANPTAYPQLTTQYTLTITDTNSCVKQDSVVLVGQEVNQVVIEGDTQYCLGDSILLMVNDTTQPFYKWYPDTTITTSRYTTELPLGAYDVSVEITLGNGCKTRDSIQIVVNGNPKGSIIGNLVHCSGEEAFLQSVDDCEDCLYEWQVEDTLLAGANIQYEVSENHTIRLVLTNSFGCSDSVNREMLVYPSPDVIIIGDTVQCPNSVLQLEAFGGERYTWMPTDLIEDPTASVIQLKPLTQSEYFTVVVENEFGCRSIDSVFVDVALFPDIEIVGNLNWCVGDTVELAAQGGEGYEWGFLGMEDTSSVIQFVINQDETISLLVDRGKCGSEIIQQALTVSPSVEILLTEDTVVQQGIPAMLTANGLGTWLWRPDSVLDCSNCQTVNVLTEEDQIIHVTHVDLTGCVHTDSISIVFADLCQDLAIPNAFTPNGDGLNDVFLPLQRNNSLSSLSTLSIYNSWGKRLYWSANPVVGWTGIDKHKEATPGIYTYAIEYECLSTMYKQNGSVLIIK